MQSRIAAFALAAFSLLNACGDDDSSVNCERVFAADTTVQRFIQQMERAVSDRDCESANLIFTVLNLTAQPYEDCGPARQELDSVEAAYQDLMMNCQVDTTIDNFRATVSGAVNIDFQAESLVAGEPLVIFSQDGSSITVVANDFAGLTTTTYQIAINLTSYSGTGSYVLGLASGNTAILSETTANILDPANPEVVAFAALSGTVDVVETNGTIIGIFFFTGASQDFQTVTVSDGLFLIAQ